MATEIVVGNNYFTNFTGGQGIPDVADYFDYSPNLDVTLITLKDTINSVIAELRGIAGPNALFGQDVMFGDDLAIITPLLDLRTGRIGISPVTVTINGGDASQLDVSAGAMALVGVRVDVTSQTKSGAGLGGGSLTAFVAMDVNGITSITATPATQLFDIYEAEWNGSIFTSVSDQLETFLDGDEWYEMRTEPVATLFNPDHDPLDPFNPIVHRYRAAHTRLDNIVRFLSGFTTNTDGDASTAQIIAGGSAAAPRIGLGDGTVSAAAGFVGEPDIDANAGLYRSAASTLSYSTGSTERVRLDAEGIGAVPAGSATAPSIALLASVDLGFYRHASNEIGFTCNGVAALSLRQTNLRAAIAGSAAQPFYTCDVANRDDGGMYFPADGEMALGTSGVEALRIDAQGNTNLPTQSRVKGVKTTSQTMLDGTATDIQFTEADVDEVGAWHTPGADTAGEEFTVPTGADGGYWISMNFEWAASATNGRDFMQEITVQNVAIATSQRETVTDEIYEDTITGYVVLAATEVVRARVTQTDNVGTLSLDIESATLSIVKVN
jgi:hypothetical protein